MYQSAYRPCHSTETAGQGSIIGPLQFIAYAEDIQEFITLNYHLYADDTHVTAKLTERSTDVACHQLENCVASMQQWCASRRLQLNAHKTELIWFGFAAHLEHLQTESVGLTVAGVNVEAVDCVRDLGVYLDNRLDLPVRAHIGRVVSTC